MHVSYFCVFWLSYCWTTVSRIYEQYGNKQLTLLRFVGGTCSCICRRRNENYAFGTASNSPRLYRPLSVNRNLTYSAPLYVDITKTVVKDGQDPIETQHQKTFIGKLPYFFFF
jgi:DNA-directed RNA polymerase beta subunit